MRIVTVHISYKVPNLQLLHVPWRLYITHKKVMDLVSEAHFPAHLPPLG